MVVKYVHDPILNRKVSKIMDAIISEIVNQYHPRSIIIMGSLGRGEGIISEDHNGNILFHSDCEMIIYPLFNILKYKEIRELRDRLYRKYKIKLDIGGFKFTTRYSLRISKPMRLAPTIENYDLKYGSTVVYGENILDKIEHINCEDIPLWEGLRLVFNRMAELLELYSLDIRKSHISQERQQDINYRIFKLVLAVQDLLLIRSTKYHTSYKQRNEIFQNIFPQEYKKLCARMPGFTSLTITATSERTNKSYVSDMNPFMLWDEVLIYTDEILRYILFEDLNISFNSYDDFQEHFLSNPYVMNKCFRGLSPRPIYQNSKCILINALLFKNNLEMERSTHSKPWFQLVYSTIPILYFSTYQGNSQALHTRNFNHNLGSSDNKQFQLLLEGLPAPRNIAKNDLKQEWDYVKQQILNFWALFCCACGE